MVTSLHDGMNLVAKEFIASRDDQEGALILSQFTGAARELRDAIIVNPYDVEQLAEAIRVALEMDTEERQTRMKLMRSTVMRHNVFAWAGSLITELSEIRIEEAQPEVGHTDERTARGNQTHLANQAQKRNARLNIRARHGVVGAAKGNPAVHVAAIFVSRVERNRTAGFATRRPARCCWISTARW